MPRGIIIFGPAGAGKTTLGKMVARQLDYPYFDIDDYIWRKDTEFKDPFGMGENIAMQSALPKWRR